MKLFVYTYMYRYVRMYVCMYKENFLKIVFVSRMRSLDRSGIVFANKNWRHRWSHAPMKPSKKFPDKSYLKLVNIEDTNFTSLLHLCFKNHLYTVQTSG